MFALNIYVNQYFSGEKNKLIKKIMFIIFILNNNGGAMASDERSESCFVIDHEKICVNEKFKPGKIIKNEGYSRVKLFIDDFSIFKDSVAFIVRHGDARDNPGKSLYDYAIRNSGENIIQKIDDNEDYTLFESIVTRGDRDFLFFAKQTNEYFIYRCPFVNTCVINGTYEGKLGIRIDFGATNLNRQDMAGLFKAFLEIKSEIFKE